MRGRASILALCVATVACVATASTASGTASASASNRLRAFDGCPQLLSYFRERTLPLVGAYGVDGGVVGIGVRTPPATARDALAGAKTGEVAFSGTNVQEAGVDEPDIVKTDGRTLFVVSGGRLSAIDVHGRRPRRVGALRHQSGAAHGRLLPPDMLLLM